MLSHLKLPFGFDATGLRSDLERIAAGDWAFHFNKRYFEGEWTGVALRSINGSPTQLYPDPQAAGALENTPVLAACPNARAVLAMFQCPLRTVRFLRLSAGSAIREHRDYDLGYEQGQVRFHVPVLTNSEVEFFLDGHRIEMKEGECWYLDLSLPHWVKNDGVSDRVHLVIDCEVNEWVRDLLAPASTSYAALDHPSSPLELQRFRQAVLSDLDLQRRLRATEDPESFIRLVVSEGNEHGYRFASDDVVETMRTARLSLTESWTD